MDAHLAPTRCEAHFTLADLEYDLPDRLVAQQPLEARDAARLLVLQRDNGSVHDSRIGALPEWLHRGDLLVLNDTKVLPAKFVARRATGGKMNALFVREVEPSRWEVLLEGSRRLRPGETLIARHRAGARQGPADSPCAEERGSVGLRLLESLGDGFWRVEVDSPGAAAAILKRIGMTPLPPYIRRGPADHTHDAEDQRRYQTVYARRAGAVAAPTAGLHLTEALLDRIRQAGVDVAFVTLHVGVGTFKPINASPPSQHTMHAEWYELPEPTAEAVARCRRNGGRVVAVGTTSARVLESAAGATGDGTVTVSRGMTNLYIYPPYRFRVIDSLLTNFHLPRSTLLALVMAFAGVECVRRTYRHAVAKEYRFYSFGDAMFIV